MSQPYPPPYPQPSAQPPSFYPAYPANPYQQPPVAPPYPANLYQQPPVAPPYPANPYQQPPVAPPTMGSADATPPDVFQQAAAYQLGTQLQTYKPRYGPLVSIGITVGVIVLDIIFLIALSTAAHIISIYLLILPIIMIIFAVRSIMIGNMKIYVFTNGLIQAKGQQRDVIRWDQIEAVWKKITRIRYYYFVTRMSYKYTVRRSDGASFTFGSPLQNIAALGTTLEQEVTRLHAPRAMAAYNSGAPLVFGPFTLNLQGISDGKELLPWGMVKSITVSRGFVSVHKEGQMLRWAAASVGHIPNYLVFVTVTNNALRSVGKAIQAS